MIAAKAGVPIIPATVCGSYRPFSKIKVIYGDPYYIEKKGDRLSKEDLSEMSRDIMRRVHDLAEGK